VLYVILLYAQALGRCTHLVPESGPKVHRIAERMPIWVINSWYGIQEIFCQLEQQIRSLLAQAGPDLDREQADHVHTQLAKLTKMPGHTRKVGLAGMRGYSHCLGTRLYIGCASAQAALQEHPYEASQTSPPTFLVKTLRSCTFPAPVQTKSSLLHLSLCDACKSRPPGAIDHARKKLAMRKEVNSELHSLVRRLSFQIHTPGGPQNLKRCIYDLSRIGINTDVFVPPVWRQAVSPRFLRRLCKLYTASDLTVDHSIPTLHYRSNVLRSPYQGELYVSDRFR